MPITQGASESYNLNSINEYFCAADTEKMTTSATYTKLKEIRLTGKGSIKTSFRLKSNSAGTMVYGKVYKNGVAIGTERSNNTTSYIEFSENFSGINDGDLIQLYAHSQGVVNVLVDQFRLFGFPKYTIVTD